MRFTHVETTHKFSVSDVGNLTGPNPSRRATATISPNTVHVAEWVVMNGFHAVRVAVFGRHIRKDGTKSMREAGVHYDNRYDEFRALPEFVQEILTKHDLAGKWQGTR